jgi:hypothetical protein
MTCDAKDSDGRQLIASGAWNDNTSFAVRGGQTMHFRVTNGNPGIGTQLEITSPTGPGGGKVLIPIIPTPVDIPIFDSFGNVPVGWHFDIAFAGDAHSVLWCLYSDWVPTMPVIEQVDPTTGIAGTEVIISGPGMGGVTAVKFGAADATITQLTDRQVTATAPTGQGTIDITVTTPVGTSAITAADKFTYIPPPAITAVDPTRGLPGTQVTVTGTGFTGATDITFGPQSVPPSGLTDTQFTVTAPDGQGTVDITVTTAAGKSSASTADQFTYTPAPAVTGVNPGHGLPGDTATVIGTGFIGATGVAFGGQTAGLGNVTDTEITVTVPAGNGTVDVTITTPAGTSPVTGADQFTYTPAPAVTGVNPNQGTAGDTVTIQGNGFTGLTNLGFGPVSVQPTEVTDTEITVTVPAGNGTVDVTVATPAGTSPVTGADQFTYTG